MRNKFKIQNLNKHSQEGFTLIEVLVVSSITVILMSLVAYVLMGSMKTAKRSQLESKVSRQGDWLMVQLKNNLALADTESIVCSGNRVMFTNKVNGVGTTLLCTNGASVASVSGTTNINLLDPGVFMRNCNTFVDCSLPPAYPLPIINFRFTIGAGNTLTGRVEDYVEKSFTTSITIRK